MRRCIARRGDNGAPELQVDENAAASTSDVASWWMQMSNGGRGDGEVGAGTSGQRHGVHCLLCFQVLCSQLAFSCPKRGTRMPSRRFSGNFCLLNVRARRRRRQFAPLAPSFSCQLLSTSTLTLSLTSFLFANLVLFGVGDHANHTGESSSSSSSSE